MKVSIKSPAFRSPASSLLLALTGLVVLGASSVQAQQPRTISDCRAIQGELARYACYESLEVPAAAGGAAPPAAAPQAPAAAPSAPARPVSNLPVVRRPSLNESDLTGESAAPAAAGAPATAVVRQREEEEKPGLLRRLLPFGGDDDEQEEEVAEAAPAAPAASGDNAVDSFGRTGGANGARVETNDEGLQELVDTVASLKTINQSMVEVTLESGQVWRQMISKRYPITVGDTVTIRPTRWGSSFRLTSERVSGYIQVERVD